MLVVFLSPHMDDAVLSCGGLIHQLGKQGTEVTVLTVMGGDPPEPLPDSPLIRELHARWQAGESPVAARRTEEQAAVGRLGASPAFWNLPDCVYRTRDGKPLYPHGDDDLFGAVHADDPARHTLAEHPLPAADVIYVPLGVGNHVDHQLVRDWAVDAWRAAPETIRLWFYEDYPYSHQSEVVQRALGVMSSALASVTVELTQADYEAKAQAAARYESQISTFWPDVDAMRARIYEHLIATGGGALGERYWHFAG